MYIKRKYWCKTQSIDIVNHTNQIIKDSLISQKTAHFFYPFLYLPWVLTICCARPFEKFVFFYEMLYVMPRDHLRLCQSRNVCIKRISRTWITAARCTVHVSQTRISTLCWVCVVPFTTRERETHYCTVYSRSNTIQFNCTNNYVMFATSFQQDVQQDISLYSHCHLVRHVRWPQPHAALRNCGWRWCRERWWRIRGWSLGADMRTYA